MRIVTGAELRSVLPQRNLTERLRQAFRSGAQTSPPARLRIDTYGRNDADVRVEPVWTTGKAFGVRVAGRFPDNADAGLSAGQGAFLLMDGRTGVPRAVVDGPALSRRRAAATSALAAGYLARNDAGRLLVVGAGPLALELIEAYTQTHPVKHVLIWARRPERARALAGRFHRPKFRIEPTDDLEGAVRGADIIACATAATQPLIRGEWLTPGAHLDLLGSISPDHREADDQCFQVARVFVETREGVTRDGGDVVQALSSGALREEDIAGDLFDLTRGERAGRRFYDQITLFKSVGTPLEDLTAAEIAVEQVIHNDTIR